MFKISTKNGVGLIIFLHQLPKTSEEKSISTEKSKGEKKVLKMAVTEDEKRNSTVEISGLRFTYPGIDGHPPPGSKPLIEDFSITLNSSDRCLLVGSNGAGT